MKKFVALLLALLLMLVNVAALADDPVTPDIRGVQQGSTTESTTGPAIQKTYETTGTSTNVFPVETLEFEVTPGDNSYPAVTVGSNNQIETDGTASISIPVTVPAAATYGKAGKYHYTVKEKEGSSQAVGYDSNKVFNVDVYVFYKVENNAVTNVLEQKVVIYSGTESEANKDDKFKNTYQVGSLKVGKVIAGNLADPNKLFDIKVTLTAEKTVANDIKISSDNGATIPADTATINKSWKGNKEITFQAKGGQSIVISDIPVGVTYTIEEVGSTKHLTEDTAELQIQNVNDADAYYVSGEVKTANAVSKTATEETITNKKDITIPTGISVETLPYILILAVAMAGTVLLVIRKKEEE